jgi:hypothetical protein
MRKLWKPALLLSVVGVMAIGLLGSGAWFTDAATSNTASISSGTLSIDDAQVSHLTIGSVSEMAPGDVTGNAEIIIKNNGTLNLAWFGDLAVSGDTTLKSAVYIDYAQMEFLSPSGANWQAGGPDNFITAGVGSGPYPGLFNSLAALSPFGVNTLSVFDENNGMGVGPYEFNGALKPGYSYKLTLRFGLAPLANNDYQDKGPMDITFTVKAAQIKAGAITAEIPAGYSWYVPGLMDWLNAQIADQIEP